MSDLPDVQPYLKSICDRYQQWSRDYTPTDASGKQQPKNKLQSPFDFGLMVQTVKKESREPEKEEQVERFPVLEGIRKYAKNHILLVGRPGSGKSTALARLLLEEATQQTSLPVLVELRYWQGSIEQLILDSLAQHGLRVEQLEMVLERLAQGATPKETLFLFDGVNELPSEEARSQLSAFRRNHPKLPMIFTTRDLSLGGDLGIEKKLEMQPLTETQMQAFVRSYVPEQTEEMLRQLNDRLREFGQTPLLLWMLCEVIRQSPDSTLPTNLGSVFKVFTEAYEQSSVRKHEVAALKGDTKSLSDRRLWKKALKALAFLMMQGKEPVDFRVVIDRNEAERELSRVFPKEQFPVRDILDDLLKYHLLQNRSVDQIEFRHQLIQEYYAAEALLEQLPQLNDEQLKQECLKYLKWTEPVALMLALLDEAQALRVVELALDVDLQLGSRLAGEVKPDFVEITLKLLDEISTSEKSTSRKLYIRLLGKSRADEATATLERALKDIDLMWVAIDALGEISSSKALDILFQAVQQSINVSENNYACEIILKLFSEICSQHTSNYLQQIAKNHIRSDIRAFAARELRSFSSDDVIQTLYESALDKDDYVRQKASFALRTIGSQKAIDAEEKAKRIWYGDKFYDAMNTMTSKTRVNPEMFVSRISNEVSKDSTQSIPTEIKSLRDYLKRHFNVEIEAHKTDDLLCLLEVLLDHADADLRLNAIWALGAIGDSQAVALLSKALEDPNFDNRANAAGRLGHIRLLQE